MNRMLCIAILLLSGVFATAALIAWSETAEHRGADEAQQEVRWPSPSGGDLGAFVCQWGPEIAGWNAIRFGYPRRSYPQNTETFFVAWIQRESYSFSLPIRLDVLCGSLSLLFLLSALWLTTRRRSRPLP